MTNERIRLEDELKLEIGEFEGFDGIITWRSETTTDFDEAAFKLEHEKLYQAFVRARQVRRFLLNDPCHKQQQ